MSKKKVAKIIVTSFITRVIVNEDATADEIIETARPLIAQSVKSDLYESIESIMDDKEVPFGESPDDKKLILASDKEWADFLKSLK